MNNDVFETMPVPKAYFKMALPVVFGMVISLVYNMVDTWFIAKTQNTSLVAGVSLCAPVFSLMIAFGDIFGLGGSSAISRLFGKKDYDTARRISAFCLLGSIFFGIAVAVLMLLFQTPILHLLGARDDTIAYAGAYYRFLVLGCPAIIFNIVPIVKNFCPFHSICTRFISLPALPIYLSRSSMLIASDAVATHGCTHTMFISKISSSIATITSLALSR